MRIPYHPSGLQARRMHKAPIRVLLHLDSLAMMGPSHMQLSFREHLSELTLSHQAF